MRKDGSTVYDVKIRLQFIEEDFEQGLSPPDQWNWQELLDVTEGTILSVEAKEVPDGQDNM